MKDETSHIASGNGRIIFDETRPLNIPLACLDPAALRVQFRELFDRAAEAVNRAGHDLDEVLVSRLLECRGGANNPCRWIQAEQITDLATPGREGSNDGTEDADGTGIVVAAIRVVARLDSLPTSHPDLTLGGP